MVGSFQLVFFLQSWFFLSAPECDCNVCKAGELNAGSVSVMKGGRVGINTGNGIGVLRNCPLISV